MEKNFKEILGTVVTIGVVLSPVIIAGVAIAKQNKETKEKLAKLKAYKEENDLEDDNLKEEERMVVDECAYLNPNIAADEDRAILASRIKNLYSKARRAKNVDSFKSIYDDISRIRGFAFEGTGIGIAAVIAEEKRRIDDAQKKRDRLDYQNEQKAQRQFEMDKVSAIGNAISSLAKAAKPDPIQIINNIGDAIKKAIPEEA